MAGAGGTEVGRISIKVVPDTDGIRRDLREDLEEIERTMRATVHINAELDSTTALSQFFSLISFMRGHSVTINVDADTGAAMTQIAALSGFSRTMNIGGGGGFGGIGTMLQVLAVISLLAPALALVSGLLATIPGLIMLVATPLAAVMLGLDGIKEAFAPLGDEVQKLKDRMNGAWFAELSKHIPKLERFFEVIGSEMGLPRVASAMSEAFGGLVNGLTSNESLGNLYTILNNVAQLIAQITPGLDDLTSGFLDLAAGVTAEFPSVGVWFNDMAKSFKDWVTEVMTPDEHGESPMERAMKTLGTALQTVLDLLGDLAGQGWDWLQDPAFADDLTGFLDDMKTLINDTLPALAESFETIADAIKTISDAVSAVKDSGALEWKDGDDQPWWETALTGQGPAVSSDWVSSFLPEGWEGSIGQGFSDVWTDISTTLGEEVDIWKGYIEGFTFEVYGAFQTVASTVSSVWNGVGPAASAAWNGVVSIVSNAISGIANWFAQIPSRLSGAWSTLSGIASGAWNGIVTVVSSAFSNIINAVVSGAGNIMSEIGTWPGRFVSALGDIGSLLLNAGVQLVQGFINGITSMIGSAVSAAGNLVSSVVGAVTSGLDINSPSRVMDELGSFTGQGFAEGLGSTKDQIVATAREIMQAAKDIFGDASGLNLNFNFGAMQDTMTSVTQSATDLTGAMSDLSAQAATDPSLLGGPQSGDLEAQADMLEMKMKELEIEAKKAALEGNDARAKELRLQKEQLALQRDQLKYQNEYGDSVSSTADEYGKMLGSAMNVPVDFAKATGQQFLQDLGISGNGFIPKAITEGIQYIFQVGSVDEALSVKDREESKQALSIVGRNMK